MPDFFLDEFLTSDHNSKKSHSKPAAKTAQGSAPAGETSGRDVDQIFHKIMAATDEEIVKKTNAVFGFHVKGADGEMTRWYLDLKNGSGSAGKGDSPSSPADATLIMDSQDFIKMFQGFNPFYKFT